MKALIVGVTLGIALAGFSSGALAACPGTTRVNEPALTALLTGGNPVTGTTGTGATVCVPAVTVDPMQWQELHQPGGSLVDYKRGPGHPTDPSEAVGTWRVTGSNRGAFVTHDYGGGQAYTYSVYNNGDGTYSFCGTGPEIKARIKPGGGPC